MGKVIKGKWDKSQAAEKSGQGDPGGRDKVYQLRISLEGSKPEEIWRRFLVSGNTTLSKLHRVIQAVMDWTDTHLHEFIIDNVAYSEPDPEFGVEGVQNEKKVHLYQVAPRPRKSFLYVYDFGDDWAHKVTVEKIMDKHERFSGKPVCLGGERACPPEDSGGIYSYYEKLDIIEDPGDPDYEDILEWLGDDFDPDYFDVEETNEILKKMR